MSAKRVAILISGRGSNMEALLEASRLEGFPAQINLVISNEPSAMGLERAVRAGVRALVVEHRRFKGRQAFEEALDKCLREANIDIVCLAGFMRILSPWFVERWENRVINIHPSLLPSFQGLDTHARALRAGVRFHGCTVHLLGSGLDDGPVITQAVVPVLPNDNPASLSARVLEAEHRIYPLALRLLASGKVKVEGGRCILDGAPNPLMMGALLNPPEYL